MSEKMKYYLGTGTTFNKAQCREYKTPDGALNAAKKDESLVVWDENGNCISSLTDDVPEGALEENEQPETGTETPTVEPQGDENEAKTEAAENVTPAENDGENEANTAPEDEEESGEETEEIPAAGITNEQIGKFSVTVVCDGSLRLRRSASWDNSNECGRASRGQQYTGKRLFMLDGAPMLETVDGLFLSAAAEHVKIER